MDISLRSMQLTEASFGPTGFQMRAMMGVNHSSWLVGWSMSLQGWLLYIRCVPAPELRFSNIRSESMTVSPEIPVSPWCHNRNVTYEILMSTSRASLTGRDKVPTKGLIATHRFAVGTIFVYQLALLYRFDNCFDLYVGLNAFLKAA